MSVSERTHLRPVYQIGICLVLIVVVRLYYAWIESQTDWLYPLFADSPGLLCALYFGLVPIVSLMAGILCYRYFSAALTIPCAAVGGGTAGLIVNSILGAMIGAAIGFVIYSRTIRQWVATGVRVFLQFDLPALVWGICLGSIATSIFVRTSDRAGAIRIGLLVVFFIGIATLLVLAVRTYREQRGRLAHAIVGCLIASGLGLAIGPMANTLYRVYALSQVGDISWNPMPRFRGVNQNMWEIYGIVLDGETTDAHLRLLHGLPAVTSISIRDANLSDETVAEVFGNLPNLELLALHNVPISDKGLAPLEGSTRLIHLTLTGTNITDQTLTYLASVPTLQLLEVDSVTLNGGGLRKLARNGRLRYLSIENTPLTDDHLADLKRLLGLRTLRLVNTEITGSGLKHLSKLPWLDNVTLAHSPMDDRHLVELQTVPLKFLSLDGIPLSDEGATAIARMTGLAALSVRRANVTDAQLQILGNLPPSTQLTLDGSKLTLDATQQLVAEDVTILIDDATITVADVERLIAIGLEVQLSDCQLDEASIERLADHKTEPHFVIRVPVDDKQIGNQLNAGSSVQVIRYWPNLRAGPR